MLWGALGELRGRERSGRSAWHSGALWFLACKAQKSSEHCSQESTVQLVAKYKSKGYDSQGEHIHLQTPHKTRNTREMLKGLGMLSS